MVWYGVKLNGVVCCSKAWYSILWLDMVRNMIQCNESLQDATRDENIYKELFSLR